MKYYGSISHPKDIATKEYVDAHSGGADEIFWADYGTTSATDIYNKVRNGILVLCKYGNRVYYCYFTQGNGVSSGYLRAQFFCFSEGQEFHLLVEDTWTPNKYTLAVWTNDTTGYAPLASPALTGVPTAPTAAPDTNSTQIATTAFVQDAISSSSGGGGTIYTAGDGIRISNNEISLNESYVNYLENATYQKPSITAFNITDLGGDAEIGTTVSVNSFTHRESDIANVSGKLTLRYDGADILTGINPSASSVNGNFTAQRVTGISEGDKAFTLRGMDVKGNAISKDMSKHFYIPKFIGSSTSSSITAADILAMSRGKTQPDSLTLSEAAYIYFVTNGTITNVKDSDTGFSVPLEDQVTTAVSINGINVRYHVYRTSKQILAGSYSFTVT